MSELPQFLGFAATRVPSGWNSTTLDFAGEVLDNRRIPLKQSDRETKRGKIPYYGATGVIDWVDEHLFDEPIILLAEDGANITSRAAPVVFLETGPCWVNNHAHVLRAKEDYSYQWLAHYLESLDYAPFSTGTAQPKLNQASIRSIPVLAPPLPEQRKIAAILTSVDAAIDGTQAVIGQLQVVKKAMMAELLTRGIPGSHTKFKMTEIGEVPEEWDVVPLRDVLTRIGSGWSPQCDSTPAAINEWGILRTTSVVWDGWNDAENKRLPSSLTPRPELEVQVDDVLVTRAGPGDRVGVVVHVGHTRPRLMISDKIVRLHAHPRVRPAFLALALATEGAQTFLLKRKTGLAASQVNLSQDILCACPVPLPPLEEQDELVVLVASLRKRLSANVAMRASLEELKSALMSVLLTGEVRVQPDEVVA